MSKRKLTKSEIDDLLAILRKRFESNSVRHIGVKWDGIESRLRADTSKLWSLGEMERTGGEPDVIAVDKRSGEVTFADCSPESPKGRRSVCYDQAALDSRKEHKPAHSAVGMAAEMGITILDETAYRDLQKLGEFDLKTSSWIATPADVRARGGAMFCDRRYDQVWTYHNGAESYYAARGFRGFIKI